MRSKKKTQKTIRSIIRFVIQTIICLIALFVFIIVPQLFANMEGPMGWIIFIGLIIAILWMSYREYTTYAEKGRR